MSSLSVEASLIVATFQLLAVRAVTNAISAADKASAITEANALIGQSRFEYYNNQTSHKDSCELRHQPHEEYRNHNHRDAIYEPRPVIHPHPREEQVQLSHDRIRRWEPVVALPHSNPIQPPWKVLPWEIPVQPRQTVKIRPHHTDVTHKGAMLDLFV